MKAAVSSKAIPMRDRVLMMKGPPPSGVFADERRYAIRASVLHLRPLGPTSEEKCLRGLGPNSASSWLNIGPAGAR